MKTLFCESLKKCNIFSEEQLNLKDCPFTWNSHNCLLLLLLKQLLMIYCHYFEFSYALLVFITGTVKGSRCCLTRHTNVWWGDSFSPGAHSQSLVLQGGRMGWAAGIWQKQSQSMESCAPLKGSVLHETPGWGQRHEIIAKVSNNSSGREHDSKSKYMKLGDLCSWYTI